MSKASEAVGLPPRPFLYTLDQLASLVAVTPREFKRRYIFYQGHTPGVPRKNMMVARDIAPEYIKHDWRVTEEEFVRWMRHKGFVIYDRSYPT